MYNARMNSYYPAVVQSILEFKAIIDGESPEFTEMNNTKEAVISNAYLTKMDEGRIEQWEQILNIKPVDNSTLEDRKETIIARIRGQGKLNTALINNIVNTFTGGSAESYIEDGVLYVKITPPPNDKQYKFANVEQELKTKVPAHLGLSVSRDYSTWSEVFAKYPTWQDVKDNFNTWEDVYLFVSTK